MKNSQQRLPNISTLLIGSILALLSLGMGAQAQTQPGTQAEGISTSPISANPSPNKVTPQPPATPEVKTAINPAQATVAPAKDAAVIDPAKKNLEDLASYYQCEAERIALENQQLKELYAGGLIARIQLEASDKSLVDARAKAEEMRRQVEAEPAKQAALSAVVSGGTWTTGNQKIDALIRDHGKLYGVDPYLIYCVMSQESSFSTNAVSPKGARGLMQLMPATAARYGVVNRLDPQQSIRGGTRYLKDLLELFNGRVDLALAGYNAGEGAVMKYGNRVPPYAETQSYVRLISKRYFNGKVS